MREGVEEDGPDGAGSVEGDRRELVGKLGENIVVRGAARMEAGPGETLAEYVHRPANKIGALVRLRGSNPVAGRQLAMHIASAAPSWISREEVPADVVDAERQVYVNSDEVRSKPEQARAKIVEGMLNKRFFAAYPGGVLLEQLWIHDSGTTVAKALASEGAEVVEFVRYSVG